MNSQNKNLFDSRSENFDVLRLFAAYSVLFAHHFDLTSNVGPSFFGIGFGGLGVAIFFAISGYLVTGSYFSDPDFGRFMIRRVLRIFPGLAVCVLVVIFLVGPYATTLDTREYFSHGLTWQYLKNIALIIRYELPGVFAQNPFPKAVNGSLWTIPIEFSCYVMLATACWLLAERRKTLLVMPVLAGVALCFWVSVSPQLHAFVRASLPKALGAEGQFVFHLLFPIAFFVGVGYRSALSTGFSHARILSLTIFLALVGLAFFPKAHHVAHMLLISVAVIWFGRQSQIVLPKLIQRNDISYGVYLYAFIVQQLVYQTGFQKDNFWMALVLVITMTTVVAMLSCKFVEQPILKFKPRRKPV